MGCRWTSVLISFVLGGLVNNDNDKNPDLLPLTVNNLIQLPSVPYKCDYFQWVTLPKNDWETPSYKKINVNWDTDMVYFLKRSIYKPNATMVNVWIMWVTYENLQTLCTTYTRIKSPRWDENYFLWKLLRWLDALSSWVLLTLNT